MPGQATWVEVPQPATVLLPVGSTEQHGPHLPLDTDSLIAGAMAHALTSAPEVPDPYLAPALPFGASGEHFGFPGTTSLGTAALRLAVIELCRSLCWADRVVVLNGHGGNLEALGGAVTLLRAEGRDVAWVNALTPADAQRAGVVADAHAGLVETSVMLHLNASVVRSNRSQAGNTLPLSDLMPLLMRDGIRAHSPTGVLGDPSQANAALGEQIWRTAVARVRRAVAHWASSSNGLLTSTAAADPVEVNMPAGGGHE